MLCESLAWRRHHNIDNIREIWHPPEPLLSYYCGGWHNTDKGIRKSVSNTLMLLYTDIHSFWQSILKNISEAAKD